MFCYARQLLFAVIAVLAVGHMLAACGQKGPLYLPDQESGQTVDRSAEQPPASR